MFALPTLIQHNTRRSSQYETRKGNQRQTDDKENNNTVPICRWHDYVHRKYQTTQTITPRSKK